MWCAMPANQTDMDEEAAMQRDHVADLLERDWYEDAHEQAVFVYGWNEMYFQLFANEHLPNARKC